MILPTRLGLRWRRRVRIIALSFLLQTVIHGAANAAFEYERGSVASYALGGVIAADRTCALDLLINPSIPVEGNVTAEGWVSRLYNMGDFELGAGALAVRYRAVTTGFAAVQLTGSDFYWERETSGIVGLSVSRSFRVGARVDFRELEYAHGFGTFNLASVSMGLWWQATARMNVAIAVNGINRPAFTEQSRQLPLSSNVSLSYSLNSAVSIYGMQEFSDDYSDRLRIGQKLIVADRFSLLMGLSTNPTELSGGVILDFFGFAVEYGYRNNVYLGSTHRVGMSWSY